MESPPTAYLQDHVDSVRFQERLSILVADMELIVDQLQWVTEQVHQIQAIDNKNCVPASAERKLHSSTHQSLEGQFLESTGSSQPHISLCGYASWSSGQISVSGKDAMPAVHFGGCAAGVPKKKQGSFSLTIEIFKVDSIQGMPRKPSSKSLTNIWGTKTQDVLTRKQVAAANLEASIEKKMVELLGRRRLGSSNFLLAG